MDVEYKWLILQKKNCRQFSLQFPPAFIGGAVYPVGGKKMGVKEGDGEDRYFSPLQS